MGYALKGLMFVDRALQLDPRHATAYDTRATIHEALDRKAEAVSDFQSALSLDPSLQVAKTD
jgi:Tfp pilus assembly protein PilF